jgi:mannose-6-phosphate isomerase
VSDLLSQSIHDPLVFDTYCRPQVWGGRYLGERLGRTLPTDGPYGESWDLCSQTLHVSRVIEGQHAGRDLAQLWSHCGAELTGADQREPFPLLLKWLECRELLSLQVHPDDEMACRVLNEPYGKSEAWVVIYAEPTARIFAGLKRGVTRSNFVTHLNAGTLKECLHSFTPVPGDCISIPAGTIHAAGGGLVVAEVQQSSDATFRLFDWNRLGLDGKPRPLQIDRALEAINWNQGPVSPTIPVPLVNRMEGVHSEMLVNGSGFRMDRYTFQREWATANPGEFTLWMVLDGAAELRQKERGYRRRICRGETIVVPACVTGTVWNPENEESPVTLLCIRLR